MQEETRLTWSFLLFNVGKIKGIKDIGVNGKDKPRYVEEDIMANKQNLDIKIKCYDGCIEVIDKFIREKQKTRNIFYVSDIYELRNRIVELQEKEDGRKD